MVSVQVFSASTGRSVSSGKKVSILFSGFSRGQKTEYTDRSGTAHFDVKPGRGEIYVNGRQVYSGSIRGYVRVYI